MNEEDGPEQLFELVSKENILNKNKWTQRFITTINTSKKKLNEDIEEKINYLIINRFPASKSFILNNELIRALISKKLHHVEPVNENEIEGFAKFLLGTKIGFKKHEDDDEENEEDDYDDDDEDKEHDEDDDYDDEDDHQKL
ncbi:hypothetical protein ACTFIW_000464 [Dictyostelium discoideum]